jgi:hypothetical protein
VNLQSWEGGKRGGSIGRGISEKTKQSRLCLLQVISLELKYLMGLHYRPKPAFHVVIGIM